MTALLASVVIVSRDRPALLKRCLMGVSQLQHQPFEVVVVADAAGAAAAGEMPFADHLKIVVFEEANISAARNLGVTHAAGDVVAFLDDDAVPEPLWLWHLMAPAQQADVAAMGGFVRGRNGISFQWRAARIDRWGMDAPLKVDAQQATVLHPAPGMAVKTQGTNMAFRRDVLIALGGFDPAFRYFLDETDLNVRLAQAGHATAIVPLAEVHHGYAANALRNAARVPQRLFEIGASWAVFQRKHIPQQDRGKHWDDVRSGQRRRLLNHMIAGGMEPRDVRRLMGDLEDGFATGLLRPFGETALPKHAAAPFKEFPQGVRPAHWIVTRPLFRKAATATAQTLSKKHNVTVLCLSPTAIFHRMRFDPAGFWEQRGGLFGKSDRKAPLIRLTTRKRRLQKEKTRVMQQRGMVEKS